LVAKLHRPQDRLNQNADWYRFMCGKYICEASHHEFSDVIILDVLNHRESKELIYHWGLIISALGKLLK
jgi:hypothetical protein